MEANCKTSCFDLGLYLVGSWSIPNHVKLAALVRIDFLKAKVALWFKKKPNTFKKMIFMSYDIIWHTKKKVNEYLRLMDLRHTLFSYRLFYRFIF